MDDHWACRFIVKSDPRVDNVLVPLPGTWWSRPYEYAWAQTFAESNAVVLDAGCGVSHPFKFWLGVHCKDTHACDIDPRVSDRAALHQNIVDDLGPVAAKLLMDTDRSRVRIVQASMLDLPYGDGFFDRIFCLSVLEHLTRDDQYKALAEFRRTLKADGLVVLTLDSPTVNLAHLHEAVLAHGLEFAGPVDFAFQRTTLLSPDGTLACFRAVLRHAGGKA